MSYEEIRVWNSLGGWWSPDIDDVSQPSGYAFLGSGNGGLTRRVKKLTRQAEQPLYILHSKNGRYSSVDGIYAPEVLIDQALEAEPSDEELAEREKKAIINEEKRQRREVAKAAAEIRRIYPSMPEGLEVKIAEHAWEIGSGRVGRSSRVEGDPHELAVVAYARHNFTEYDDLLDDGFDRDLAREEIRGGVSETLREWSKKSVTPTTATIS